MFGFIALLAPQPAARARKRSSLSLLERIRGQQSVKARRHVAHQTARSSPNFLAGLICIAEGLVECGRTDASKRPDLKGKQLLIRREVRGMASHFGQRRSGRRHPERLCWESCVKQKFDKFWPMAHQSHLLRVARGPEERRIRRKVS